jgi:thymidylate kinase
MNRGFNAVLNGLNYLADTVRRYLPQQGFVVTFSGVDGAGKSTIIAEVSHNLEKQYRRKVKVLRHRPSLLPIISAWRHGKEKAEQLSVAKLPRQGKNSSQLSSLLRFGYYYADYLMGQFYVQLRYVMQGYVVLYDRYYFDFINDSIRSNIILPASFTTNGYRFLLKPRFNFFLYAHVEEILKRKQELDATTIEQLTAKYKRLFEELGNRYHNSSYQPVLNIDKTTTVSHIFNQMAIAI